MLQVIPFEPDHLLSIDLLPAQKYMKSIIKNAEYRQSLKIMGPAYTGIDENGKVIGIAGVRQLNAKTYHAWAILSKHTPKHTKSILKAIDNFCKVYFKHRIIDRIQADVPIAYVEGQRFAEHLKFKPEGLMRHYQNGKAHILYARINPWVENTLIS